MHTPKKLTTGKQKWRCLSRGWAIFLPSQLCSFTAMFDFLGGTNWKSETLLKQFPYCWWKKSCTTWHAWNPVNNGIFTISTGGCQISSINSTQPLSTNPYRRLTCVPHGAVVPAAVCKSKAPTVDSEAKGVTCSAGSGNGNYTHEFDIWVSTQK